MAALIDVYDLDGEFSRYNILNLQSMFATLALYDHSENVSRIVISSVNPVTGSINKVAVFTPDRIDLDVVEKAIAAGHIMGGSSIFGTQQSLDAY